MVERLKSHAVAGRLDAEELAVRAEAAYRARTIGELAEVLRDLPNQRGVLAAMKPERRRFTWHLPAVGTACAAGTTVIVAMLDGGFRGPLDGVAAVPFWVTVASGGFLAARLLPVRLRAEASSRVRKAV